MRASVTTMESVSPMDVAVGDVIIYGKYGGQEIKIEGIEYKILEERDVIAIVQD